MTKIKEVPVSPIKIKAASNLVFSSQVQVNPKHPNSELILLTNSSGVGNPGSVFSMSSVASAKRSSAVT